jgi:hypothetical protein
MLRSSTAGTWTWVHRVPISIPESLVVAFSPILSPSSRTFVELTLVNWRRPWGARRLDFVIRAGSFYFFRRQDQQILRLPAVARSLPQNSSSTSIVIYIVKIFNASPSRIIVFVQIDGSRDNSSQSPPIVGSTTYDIAAEHSGKKIERSRAIDKTTKPMT